VPEGKLAHRELGLPNALAVKTVRQPLSLLDSVRRALLRPLHKGLAENGGCYTPNTAVGNAKAARDLRNAIGDDAIGAPKASAERGAQPAADEPIAVCRAYQPAADHDRVIPFDRALPSAATRNHKTCRQRSEALPHRPNEPENSHDRVIPQHL
jgi:hypothetical protein